MGWRPRISNKPHHLALANSHIEAAHSHLARQHRLAGELTRDGHYAAAAHAEELLAVMEQSLEGTQCHRAIIAAEVNEEAERGDAPPNG